MSDYVCLGTESFQDIPDTDVDFKSPVDEFLMTTIRNNQRFNKCKAEEAAVSGGGNIEFKVNGPFDLLNLGSTPENGENLDGGFVAEPLTLSRCALFILDQGVGGNFRFNIRRSSYLETPIKEIKNIFSANTQSVARGSAALATQTVVNAEATQNSQLIDFAFPSIDVENMIQIQGAFQFQTNFDPDTVTLDPDIYAPGNYIVIEGFSNATNNGVFEIQEINRCGGVNIIVENLSGVTEIPTSGTVKPNAAKYFFTTAVPSNFVPGEDAVFDGHTDPTNDGTFTIFRTNDGGNNIVVLKGATLLVTQGSPGGTVESLRWRYSFLNTANDAFVVGEVAEFTGHNGAQLIDSVSLVAGSDWSYNVSPTTPLLPTSLIGKSVTFSGMTNAANDGVFTIIAVNNGGVASIVVTNGAGVAEGPGSTGVAVYANENNGSFEILSKNDDSSFNVTVYNPTGEPQPGISGQVDTNRFVYALDADPDGFFLVGDTAVMSGHNDPANDGQFTLVDVKYLGNNNVVVYNAAGVQQLVPSGTTEHLQKAIIFRSDQSAKFQSGQSLVLVNDTADPANEGEYLVVDQNRLAISSFNMIVEMPTFVEQLGDAGCIIRESRSIFTDGEQTVAVNQDKQVFEFENVNPALLAENTIVALDVLEAPVGSQTASFVVQ